MFDNLCRTLDDALMELDRKAAAGQLDESDLHYGDLIAHFAKSLDTHVAMQEADGGYSNADGSSYADDGRRYRAMRGSSYRGDSRRTNYPIMRNAGGGYSRADRMDEVVQAMSGAMGDMPEDLRREAQRFLTKMTQQM